MKRTKYIWNCGQEYSYVEMYPEDMARLKDQPVEMEKLLKEVTSFFHGRHEAHTFIENAKPKYNEVIFECTREGIK